MRCRMQNVFSLTTLGLKKNNDTFIQNAFHGKYTRSKVDKRKKRCGKINKEKIFSFVKSFNSTISHYRRERASNKRYLPSDITIQSLYKEFIDKFPTVECTHESFRKVIEKDMQVSFTKLGHEECEQCESFELHKLIHKTENVPTNETEENVLHVQNITSETKEMDDEPA